MSKVDEQEVLETEEVKQEPDASQEEFSPQDESDFDGLLDEQEKEDVVLDIDGGDDEDGESDNSDDAGESPAKDSEDVTEEDESVDEDTNDSDSESAEKESDEIPDQLLAKAREFGLSREDVQTIGDTKLLERIVSGLGNADDSQQKTQQKAEPAETNQFDEEFKVELDREIYEDDLCNAVEATCKQINSMRKALAQAMNSTQAMQLEATASRLDNLFAKADDGFKDLFGEGSLSDLDRKSDFVKNRNEVIAEMGAIVAGYNQAGRKLPSEKEVFNKAVRSLYGDKIKEQVKKELVSKVQKRNRIAISRPSNRKSRKTSSPEAMATQAVASKLKSFGFSAEDLDL